LPLAASLPGAASHAINLASITSPANEHPHAAAATQEHPAGHRVITGGPACRAHACIAREILQVRQYRDLRQLLYQSA
jgi:hypothetical protein